MGLKIYIYLSLHITSMYNPFKNSYFQNSYVVDDDFDDLINLTRSNLLSQLIVSKLIFEQNEEILSLDEMLECWDSYNS